MLLGRARLLVLALTRWPASLSRVVGFRALHRFFRPDWSEARNREAFGPLSDAPGHAHDYRCVVTVRRPDRGLTWDGDGPGRARPGPAARRWWRGSTDEHLNLDVPEFAYGRTLPTCEAIAAYVFPASPPVSPPAWRSSGCASWRTRRSMATAPDSPEPAAGCRCVRPRAAAAVSTFLTAAVPDRPRRDSEPPAHGRGGCRCRVTARRVAEILRTSRRIAVVGLSPKPERPSHGVADVSPARGLHHRSGPRRPAPPSWASRCSRTSGPRPPAGPIDIVNVFRRSEFVPALLDDLLAVRPRLVWLQVGIRDDPTARAARGRRDLRS